MTPLEKDHGAGLNGAVAAVLRGERAASGMTLEQVAAKAGIPVVTVQRLLAAKRAIDVAAIEALADALGTTPPDVVAAAKDRLARDAISAEAARDED